MIENMSKTEAEKVDEFKDASEQVISALYEAGYNPQESAAICFGSLYHLIVTYNHSAKSREEIGHMLIDEIRNYNEQMKEGES